MTQMIAPFPNSKLRRRIVLVGFTVFTVIAVFFAGMAIYCSQSDHAEREQWVESAYRGYQNVRSICMEREIYGFQQETPPMVQFLLNENGTIDNAYAAWEVYYHDNRIIYKLEVQFDNFDQEMLTRIAELDQRIDDGDLLSGEFQLAMSGFVCNILGPKSVSEQFVGNFAANSPINPI